MPAYQSRYSIYSQQTAALRAPQQTTRGNGNLLAVGSYFFCPRTWAAPHTMPPTAPARRAEVRNADVINKKESKSHVIIPATSNFLVCLQAPGTPAKLYISVRRKVYWNIQVSPRCHSLSIFVYVIFTMSKIVLRNVCVCLNVYSCPRLSIIVCNCL